MKMEMKKQKSHPKLISRKSKRKMRFILRSMCNMGGGITTLLLVAHFNTNIPIHIAALIIQITWTKMMHYFTAL